jgi:hypothetical protein
VICVAGSHAMQIPRAALANSLRQLRFKHQEASFEDTENAKVRPGSSLRR